MIRGTYLRLWDTKLFEVLKSKTSHTPDPFLLLPHFTREERLFSRPLFSLSPTTPFKRVQSSVCQSQWVECVESACGRGTGGMSGHVAPASQVTWACEQLPEMGKGRFRSSVFRIPSPNSYIDWDWLIDIPPRNIYDFHLGTCTQDQNENLLPPKSCLLA